MGELYEGKYYKVVREQEGIFSESGEEYSIQAKTADEEKWRFTVCRRRELEHCNELAEKLNANETRRIERFAMDNNIQWRSHALLSPERLYEIEKFYHGLTEDQKAMMIEFARNTTY